MPPALVQSKGTTISSGTAATTIPITLDAATTAGNLIVAWASADLGMKGTDTIDSCADDKAGGSNTYSAGFNQINDATNNQGFRGFYCIAAGSAQTVTITLSASDTARELVVMEFSGTSTTDGTFTGQVQASPGTGTDAATSGNITTVSDGCVIIGGDHVGNGTQVVGTGFTTGAVATNGAGTNRMRSEYKIQTTHGTTAATYTLGTDNGTITAVMAFKSSSVPLNSGDIVSLPVWG